MVFFKKIEKSDLSKYNLSKSGLELKICSLCGKSVCSEHYEKSAIGICWCTECIKKIKEKELGYMTWVM